MAFYEPFNPEREIKALCEEYSNFRIEMHDKIWKLLDEIAYLKDKVLKLERK